MENASKALIIAAAILIAILLISVGVYVVGVAQEQINNSDMSSIELETFNQKFTKYLGTQKGSAIRTMVQEVMAYNNSDQASDETRIAINKNTANNNAKIDGDADASLVSLDPKDDVTPYFNSTTFKNTKTYTVKIIYYKGRVAIIEIKG